MSEINEEDIKRFLLRLRDETPPAAPQPSAPSAAPAPVRGKFALPAAAISAATQQPAAGSTEGTFALRLLTASGFGASQELDRDAALPRMETAKYLPAKVRYFKPEGERQHHVVVVEFADATDSAALLNAARTVFRTERKLDLLEDALDRFARDLLDAFERKKGEGGEVASGAQHETLCVLSVVDRRVKGTKKNRLIHFSTVASKGGDDFESFTIRQECADWIDTARADEYVRRVYTRSFHWLRGASWKQAFVREAERKKIRAVAAACLTAGVDRNTLEARVVELLDEVAGSFGLPTGGKKDKRHVVDSQLPVEHDIGRPAGKKNRGVWKPPPGVMIRDQEERLLGYIVYCLDGAKEAKKFEEKLAEGNRFHNVLVLYPDGQEMAVSLWQGTEAMKGRLTRAGATFRGESKVVSFLSRFFVISRAEIDTPKQLAEELAHRARFLHDVVRTELDREERLGAASSEKLFVLPLFEEFNRALGSFTKDEFANAYAETIAYGLLSARWMARDADARFVLAEVTARLPATSPFLRALFGRLIDIPMGGRFYWLLSDLASLLDRTSVREVFAQADAQADHRDPVIHFYEDFLDAYDPARRQTLGVYYTPEEVVSCIVECTHSILIEEFHLADGLADTATWAQVAERNAFKVPKGIDPSAPFVCLLDPAVGTGTFLKKVIEVVQRTVNVRNAGDDEATRRAKWAAYVRAHLLPRLNGFELIMAPYIVAHMRLGHLLEESGFTFQAGDRLRVYLTNTLEAPGARQLDLVAKDVAHEAQEADALKKDVPVTVIVGNPPYDREEGKDGEHDGGWVRDGWDGWRGGRPLLADYIEPAQRESLGGHVKHAYNLYVYFWRWATWKVLEQNARVGVVSFITPASFLAGKAFVGMREVMRSDSEKINVLDLEGDQLGTRKSANVFAITTPVCVTWVRRSRASAAHVGAEYCSVDGTREEKLNRCKGTMALTPQAWELCGSGPQDAFIAHRGQDYKKHPLLVDLFPWQHSGCQFKRTWPIDADPEALRARWRTLCAAKPKAKADLFKETRDRKVECGYGDVLDDAKDLPAIMELKETTRPSPAARYAFRSFDRQWCLLDGRLGDFVRPTLWRTRSDSQLFMTSLLTGTVGHGPAAVCTAHVPDLHHFRGSYGGKDAIPLWRDPGASHANITQAAFTVFRSVVGAKTSAFDIFCYAYAVLAHPGYVSRYFEELRTPGLRVPITRSPDLFRKGVSLGRALIRLQTFGERAREKNDGFTLSGTSKVSHAIPGDTAHYPERYRYDEKSGTGVIPIAKGRPELLATWPRRWG